MQRPYDNDRYEEYQRISRLSDADQRVREMLLENPLEQSLIHDVKSEFPKLLTTIFSRNQKVIQMLICELLPAILVRGRILILFKDIWIMVGCLPRIIIAK